MQPAEQGSSLMAPGPLQMHSGRGPLLKDPNSVRHECLEGTQQTNHTKAFPETETQFQLQKYFWKDSRPGENPFCAWLSLRHAPKPPPPSTPLAGQTRGPSLHPMLTQEEAGTALSRALLLGAFPNKGKGQKGAQGVNPLELSRHWLDRWTRTVTGGEGRLRRAHGSAILGAADTTACSPGTCRPHSPGP